MLNGQRRKQCGPKKTQEDMEKEDMEGMEVMTTELSIKLGMHGGNNMMMQEKLCK